MAGPARPVLPVSQGGIRIVTELAQTTVRSFRHTR